jgi:hypothetical protein
MTLFNTIRYLLSKKTEPRFDNYTRIITDFRELNERTCDRFDISGKQYYYSGPTKDGLFTCYPIEDNESKRLYDEYVKYTASWGPLVSPRYKWEYGSMACNSYNQFRLDIYKPGRIVVKANISNGWSAPWLYSSQNSGDYINNPSMLPIDLQFSPRDYYWEIDVFEAFQDDSNTSRLSFSGHYGTQVDRKMKTSNIKGLFDTSKMHYFEVTWDGVGNWTWLLDSVVVGKQFIYQPLDPIYPYFMLTLAASTTIDHKDSNVDWKVDYVKFSDNLIYL